MIPSNSDMLCQEFMDQRFEIFVSPELSDSKFLVGPDSDQEIIPSFKLILAISSPVFKAMLYGPLAEKNDPIIIPDVRPSHYKVLLNYIYSNKIDLSSLEEASGVYYCAKKFLLPKLQEVCSKYFLLKVDSSSARQVYEYAQLFEDVALIEKASEIMINATKLVLSDPSFEEIKCSTLLHIFSLDKLCIDSEIELLEAAVKYNNAQKKLMPQNETELFIQRAIEKIRFLTITSKQFVESQSSRQWFSESEFLAILVNIVSNDTNTPYPRSLCPSREPRVQKTMTKTLCLTIEDFRNLNGVIYSTHNYICDFCWIIKATPEPFPYLDEMEEKFLAVYLYCTANTLSNWRCKVEYQMRLRSLKTQNKNNILYVFTKDTFRRTAAKWNFVLEPSNGFIQDGAITIEVLIRVLEYSFE